MDTEIWAWKNLPFPLGLPGTAAAVAADSIVTGLADADSRGTQTLQKVNKTKATKNWF